MGKPLVGLIVVGIFILAAFIASDVGEVLFDESLFLFIFLWLLVVGWVVFLWVTASRAIVGITHDGVLKCDVGIGPVKILDFTISLDGVQLFKLEFTGGEYKPQRRGDIVAIERPNIVRIVVKGYQEEVLKEVGSLLQQRTGKPFRIELGIDDLEQEELDLEGIQWPRWVRVRKGAEWLEIMVDQRIQLLRWAVGIFAFFFTFIYPWRGDIFATWKGVLVVALISILIVLVLALEWLRCYLGIAHVIANEQGVTIDAKWFLSRGRTFVPAEEISEVAVKVFSNILILPKLYGLELSTLKGKKFLLVVDRDEEVIRTVGLVLKRSLGGISKPLSG